MIHILTTGGTIEGLDYTDEIEKKSNKGVPIETFLSQLEITSSYIIEKVIDKDSRHITDEDRELLTFKTGNSNYEKILITHGTVTMVKTAQYLGKLNLSKTIILTGAFILGTELNTDAPSNLSFAINAFDNLKNGVYITMNNRVFHWNNVRKNAELNQFEALTD